MKAHRHAVLGAAFAATLLAAPAAMAAVDGGRGPRAPWELAALAPLVGALFGWGKVKNKDVADAFGETEELAATLALAVPAPPAIPDVRAEPIPLDVDKAMALAVRLPPVAFEPDLTALPVLTPRDWAARGAGHEAPFAKPGEMSYLELAGVDPRAALDLLEQVADLMARS